MADLRTNFITATRHRNNIVVWYDKTGKPRQHFKMTVDEFLAADTLFTRTVDVEDVNIDTVWVGTTNLMYHVEMFFSAVLSDATSPHGDDVSQVTVVISSDEDVIRPPFKYIAM